MNATRSIVSDTGPIISLEKLNEGFQFIRKLYDVILIPPAVLIELTQGQFENTADYLTHYDIADLLIVKNVSSSSVQAKTRQLDEGESQAIQLAINQRLPLLIEEQAGRRIAIELGLHISGIAGLLWKGFQENVLSAEGAKEKLNALLRTGRINAKVNESIVQAIDGSSFRQ